MADERATRGDAPYVLIADDNAYWARALQGHVAQLVDTEVAAGVGEAMDVVHRRGLPGGAALDIRLDDGCGFELLARLQALAGGHVRALMVTGWSDVGSELRRRAARLGADFLHESGPAREIQRKMVFLAYGAETWQALEQAVVDFSRQWGLTDAEAQLVRNALDLERQDHHLDIEGSTLKSRTRAVLHETGAQSLEQVHAPDARYTRFERSC